MKKDVFDIIVIGAGSGGLNIAGFINRIGLSVLLIDKTDRSIGGDCLNFGCVPSKAFIHVARQVSAGKDVERFGVSQRGAIDLRAVMDYVRDQQDSIREHESAAYFREKGMTVVLGDASFSSPDTVTVNGEEYRGKKIVIATGSRPNVIDVPGSEHIPVYTNETIFSAEHLPQHLVVVGGGPIGFEIGQSFCRLGATVTLLNLDTEWLQKEDRQVVEVLMERMQQEGVSFVPNAQLLKIEDGHAFVDTPLGEERIPCDALFLSIGRTLNLDGLNLEAAGVSTNEEDQLLLNEYLQTTNKRIFAVGDVAGLHQFTHAAEAHASVVLQNFFVPRMFRKKLNTDGMAWVTYTDPEIATFGLSRGQLTERNIPFEIIEQPFKDNDRSITDDRREGCLLLYVSKKGKILGGTMVGKDAGELASELILAMQNELTLRNIFERVYPYPTAARVNRLAAAQFLGKQLVKRKKILRMLY